MARTMKNTTMDTPSSTGTICRTLRPMYSARAYDLLSRLAPVAYAPPEKVTVLNASPPVGLAW